MSSKIAEQVDFSEIRYAQCWEDADVLLKALRVRPGDRCVSIASAGENSLSLLAEDPEEVIAVDLNPAQLACLELRVAAFRRLQHREMLELLGARVSKRRMDWYSACRDLLSEPVKRYWDDRSSTVEAGIAGGGKFENYFRLFRERVLPLVHSRGRVNELLSPRCLTERKRFFDEAWNTWAWRFLFRVFFSERLMGALGRDPAFFQYVDGPVSERILSRTRHALTELDPAENPYLHWILKGEFGKCLPHALRVENFELIRSRLDRLQWRLSSLEDLDCGQVDAWNLSDIFEYMSTEATEALLRRLVDASSRRARFCYWNMLAPRSRPESMASQLREDRALGERLLSEDKAFFYSRLIVEEVAGNV